MQLSLAMRPDTTGASRTLPAAATLVVFACATSAGIHSGIVPEHLREEPRLGIPWLDPEREALDTVGVIAVGVELLGLLGLLCALSLFQPIRRPRGRPVLEEVTR